MVLVHDCDVVVEYLLRACRRGQRSTLVHVFRALATVLFENAGRTAKVLCRSHVSLEYNDNTRLNARSSWTTQVIWHSNCQKHSLAIPP